LRCSIFHTTETEKQRFSLTLHISKDIFNFTKNYVTQTNFGKLMVKYEVSQHKKLTASWETTICTVRNFTKIILVTFQISTWKPQISLLVPQRTPKPRHISKWHSKKNKKKPSLSKIRKKYLSVGFMLQSKQVSIYSVTPKPGKWVFLNIENLQKYNSFLNVLFCSIGLLAVYVQIWGF